MRNSYGRPIKDSIPLKKKFGQHFLQDETILHKIVSSVSLDATSNIFEIGGGQGALTRTILEKPCKSLHVYEIDPEWAAYLKRTIKDSRLQVHRVDILEVPGSEFEAGAPWTLLANLPYQVTFPILYKLQSMRHLLKEGVIMVQEEVAQRLVATHGRSCGFVSIYFQWFFEFSKLDRVPPTAFYPPPKVYSRLLYFRPRLDVPEIPNEEAFWEFIKAAFKQPRRTLRNNLASKHYDLTKIAAETLALRAQQLSINDLRALWQQLQ